MKNTMKIFALMLGLVSMVMFSSCKKDNEDLIVGKWNVTTVSEGGQSYTVSQMGMEIKFEFTKDGNVTETMTGSIMGQTIDESIKGTYSVNDDKLTITADGDTEVATIKTLDKKQLIIEFQDVEETGSIMTGTITMERI